MSRLYFLEFFVTELNLDDQILRDAGEETVFVVGINFINFSTFEITQNDVYSAAVVRPAPQMKSRFDFMAGQACHFTLTPEKLLEKILRNPLSIKIFRKGDSFPLCLAELPLSGCLCDQAKSLGEGNFPKPYVFGGRIGLVDIGGNPAGNIDITLRITCNGKYVLTSYILEKGCFVFKNNPQGAEFKVEKLRHDEETKGNEAKDEFFAQLETMSAGFEWENYTRDVSGIFPSAGRLSTGKPPAKEPRVPLRELQRPPVETIEMKKESNRGKKEKRDKKNRKKNK